MLLAILIDSGCTPALNTPSPTVTLNPPGVQTPLITVLPVTPSTSQVDVSTPTPDLSLAEDTKLENSQFLFGVESGSLNFQGKEDLIQGLGVSMVRHNGLLWSDVESIEGKRDWSAVKELDDQLIEVAQLGLNPILIIRGTPEWAQKLPGVLCGPVKADKLEAYSEFIQEAVTRYSVPPYNVKFWELGNEPDVDPSLVKPDSVFGCWGDQNDLDYGGGYYAEMLKTVYPKIKAADPEAQVLIGGLLLDCDPANPPEGKECLSGNFLEGILKNDGGQYFDYVSFHGYAPYGGSAGNKALRYDAKLPAWKHRGGAVVGKVNFIQEILGKYGIEKPIFHTEGSLICHESNPECNPPSNNFEQSQADYVVWVYVRDWALGIKGAIWYQFEGPGWRQGALLDKTQNPKPAYDALKYLVNELGNAKYVGSVENISPLVGYEFIKDSKKVLVIWSPDGQSHAFNLSPSPSVIYNKYGELIDSSQADIQIESPVYLEYP